MLQLADRGPTFYAAAPSGLVMVNARALAVLQHDIAIDLVDASLNSALKAISRASHLSILFRPEDLPLTVRVTIQASRISVAATLNAVLTGTDLDVSISDRQVLSVIPKHATGGVQNKAPPTDDLRDSVLIRGVVTDASNRTPLDNVSVRIEGTSRSVVTGPDGSFSIAGAALGKYRVTARRLGYAPLTAVIAADTNGVYIQNFALAPTPALLDRVVTTVTGDERRLEVGTAISSIAVDSIAATAPVTSLTDVLSARAPSVQVVETGGLAGSGEAIRVRGQSSLVLQSDPIVIVDGVRQDNSPGGAYGPLFQQSVPSTTRLNDIDFADVEKIDIVKGPSASTEYGTDAANGVIIVTTKKGHAGAARWNATAETGVSDMPVSFPTYYYGWGHAGGAPTQCSLVPTVNSPVGSALGTCGVDSVTSWDPLNHAPTTLYGDGYRDKVDLSVSGGNEPMRYFVAGGLSQETGIARLPSVFRPQAAALAYPQSSLKPNGLNQRSIRANSVVKLSSTADLSVSGAYLSTFQTLPFSSYLIGGIPQGPVIDDSAHSFGYGALFSSPLVTFAQLGSQQNTRLTGGLTATWHPKSWLQAQATVGIDHGSVQQNEQYLPQAIQLQGGPANDGGASLTNGGTDVYSADLRMTATTALASSIRAVSSLGLQYADTRSQSLADYAFGLPNSNVTLNGIPNPTVLQTSLRQATLGGYAEEHFGVWDRLFVTGAIRVDGASGFGSDYTVAVYPKADLSLLVLNSADATLRLRGAFGQSGLQPYPGAAKQLYQPKIEYLNGSSVSVMELSAPGNPGLKPERSTEFEGGIDASTWSNRLTLEATAYQKTTSDALLDVSEGWTLGDFTFEENVGDVRNVGVELLLGVIVIDSRAFHFDVSLTGSINHNHLVRLAPGIPTQYPGNFGTNIRQEAGYPLYGFWAPRVTFSGAPQNGVLLPSQVRISDSASFLGSSTPTREASLSTRITIANGALSIGTLTDYRAGFLVWNNLAYQAAQFGSLRAQNVSGSPLSQQAANIAASAPSLQNIGEAPAGFFEPGDFVRLREVSVTYTIPRSWLRAVRFTDLSVTLAARNLALWTRYSGPDPEVSNAHGANLQSHISSLSPTVNNDVRMDSGSTPLARYWLLRLRVGL